MLKAKYKILFLLFFLIINTSIKAQTNELRFKHYTTTDGLSQGDIYHIMQDSRGFMWFATFDGLNRFDGYNFKVFKPYYNDSTSIEGARINSITEDKNGMLWVGTNEALNRYNFKTERFEHFYVQDSLYQNIKTDYTTFFVDDKNELWFVYKKNLGSINLITKKITKYSFADGAMQEFLSVNYSAKKNYQHLSKVYSVHADGLHIIDVDNKQVHFYFSSNSKNECSRQTLIASALEDKNHILWLGTLNGLMSFNPVNKQAILYDKYETKKLVATLFLAQDKNDNIWCGGGMGLLEFNTTTKTFSRNYIKNSSDPESIGQNTITSVFIDRDNNIWSGIDPLGIDKINPVYEQLNHVKINPDTHNTNYSSSIWSIAEIDTNHLLICSNHKDLITYDKITGENKKINLPESFKESLDNNNTILDSRKRIWLASDSGMCRSDEQWKTFEVITKNNFSDAYFFEYKKRMFVGNDNGLYSVSMDQQTGDVDTIHLFDGNRINFISKTPSGLLCVATADKELVLIDFSGNKAVVVTTIAFNFLIKSFFFQDNSTIWLGTIAGLFKYSMLQNALKVFTEKEGLANNCVYCLLKGNDGNLWMSTNHGICEFDMSTERFTNFGLAEGVQALEYNTHSFYQSSSGTIYFGGVKGFNYFNPLKIRKFDFEPPVELLNVSVNANTVSLDKFLQQSKDVKFQSNENNITIGFAALDFNRADNINYLYRLHNNDSWISTGNQRTLSFVNLSPGNYDLEIEAQYSYNTTSPHILKFAFTILSPFYETYWFIAFISIVIVLIIYSIYRYRINQLLKVVAMRNNIARDLHDDIGSTLGSINIYAEVAARKIKKEQTVEVEDILRKMNVASRTMIERMSDIVWSINSYSDSFESLCQRMQDFAAAMLTSREIEFTFTGKDELKNGILSIKQRKNIFLIYKEAIYNIAKYAESRKVSIVFSLKNKFFIMLIQDDGKGFNINTYNTYNTYNGNGIINMQARAKAIGAKLHIISNRNAGTSVELTVAL